MLNLDIQEQTSNNKRTITPYFCHDNRVFAREISALFDNAHNYFPTIIERPSDDDMQHLRQCNFAALQDINLGDGTNTTGLILSKNDQKAANRNQVFDRADRALEAYDLSIQDNNNTAVNLCQEKTWSCNLDRQVSIQTAERLGKKFVLSIMEKTWVVRLKTKPPSLSTLPPAISLTTSGKKARVESRSTW